MSELKPETPMQTSIGAYCRMVCTSFRANHRIPIACPGCPLERWAPEDITNWRPSETKEIDMDTKTTQEIWDSLTARQYELERRLEVQNNRINILKGKVFGDNSWASIETLCDEGE